MECDDGNDDGRLVGRTNKRLVGLLERLPPHCLPCAYALYRTENENVI